MENVEPPFYLPGGVVEDDGEVVVQHSCQEAPKLFPKPQIKSECFYLGSVIAAENCGCYRKHFRKCDHSSVLFGITTLNACQICGQGNGANGAIYRWPRRSD